MKKLHFLTLAMLLSTSYAMQSGYFEQLEDAKEINELDQKLRHDMLLYDYFKTRDQSSSETTKAKMLKKKLELLEQIGSEQQLKDLKKFISMNRQDLKYFNELKGLKQAEKLFALEELAEDAGF